MIRRLLGAACVLIAGPCWAEPAVIYDLGGKFDHSFNESVYRGAERWAVEHRGKFVEFELVNETQREQAIRFAAEKGYDPIVAVGFAAEDAVSEVAGEFPQAHFVILDDDLIRPNVESVQFRAEEGSFLVGVAAALASKSGVIGFIGGMDTPLVRTYSCGYRQGAAWADPKIQVVENMVGTTPDAWKDPTKGGELARSQIDRGADVIYAAAGGSGMGVLQTAADLGKLAIGVDSNQNGIYPGHVLTSMVNRLDEATYVAFQEVREHRWSPGLRRMGLAEAGVDWVVDANNEALISPAMRAAVERARQSIVAKTLPVADFAQSGSCPR
jgi:basic membrane protein A and related proteins